ncbi:imidazole glycerol phosphate synthase subunit HisH [Stackebrandtia soli]|uniref:imidazole glycerol phosphate synthase subunit HisH n=1 Tax=Stackebrandtia soli TaxID=1892856 RepID=UPI0039E784DC
MTTPTVAILDYGSGNLRSAERALLRAGAAVEVTSDRATCVAANGLVVPGVGAFASCMDGIVAVGGDRAIARRVRDAAPILGICVGAQVLFESGREHGQTTPGLGVFEGVVERLRADRVPHMGWNTVAAPTDLTLFDGVDPDARFYFVHSYAATGPVPGATVATCDHGGRFIAAINRGAVSATQFHPEKSADAGAAVLRNWVRSLR